MKFRSLGAPLIAVIAVLALSVISGCQRGEQSSRAERHDTEPASQSADALEQRMVERRAVEAVIWGMPAVNFELMVQATLNNKAAYNQVVYWSRFLTSKNQTLTPNPNTLYFHPFYNTKDVGPMVLEIPPAVGGSITGSVDTGWQTALEDVGPAGVDKGKGGKYLILPPGYQKPIPGGYIALRSETFTGFAVLRSNVTSGSDEDIARAVAYGKRIKFYPLSQAAHPPATVFVDAIDVLYDSTIPYDVRFYESLDRFVQREPWLARDRAMIDALESIGIEKGKLFAPDSNTRAILESAAREAHAWLDMKYEQQIFASPYFAATHWAVPASQEVVEGMSTTFADLDRYPVSDRGVMYHWGYFSAKHLGTGQFYLMATRDSKGQPLTDGSTYRLHVPPDAPVKLYWSATAYDRATHALIGGSRRSSRGSNSPELQKNSDGSVDVFFGPAAPTGKESNWVPTSAQGQFEVLFRFYGPEKPLFDKTWALPDLEKETP